MEILGVTGMTESKLSFRYLGVPLSPKKLTVVQYQPLIQKLYRGSVVGPLNSSVIQEGYN